MQSYKDLIAYQKAYRLALQVYHATGDFPRQERYGLVAQMRRAAVSIPSNIAEGYRRRSRKEYIQFLYIAQGSCSEVETQIALSRDLDYLPSQPSKELSELADDVARLLTRLIQALNKG